MNVKLCLSAIIAITVASLMAGPASAEPWKFGLMSDTQWKSNLDGQNPNTVAAGIARQLNAQFINHNVKFVIQVGDLCDTYNAAAFDTRAAVGQELINAGIGFFPLRGNHENSSAAANYFGAKWPQTSGTGETWGATNFTSPMASLKGLSYAFDYENARFVLLDQFTRKDGTASNNDTGLVGQIPWIATTLSSKSADMHAFVFAHKNLCGGNHTDMLFGANPSIRPVAQNAFYSALSLNGVRYVMGGHDHMHCRSIMLSPDRTTSLQQLICSSDSYKFYIPLAPGNDARYDNPIRETPISQELFTIGYYIFTIDGPQVTVEYYASPNGCNGDCDLTMTPLLTFSKRETFGYCLNGKEFIIPRGGSFTSVSDRIPAGDGFLGTTAAILDGINAISGSFDDRRATVNDVTTGWTSRDASDGALKSDVLTLLGMNDSVGCDGTDAYTLSLSYDPSQIGPLALAVKNDVGQWVNAAGLNVGGAPKFVIGPWKAGYGLGFYGIDPATHTVWSVINHASQFAAIASADGDQDGDGDVDNADVAIVTALRNQPASAAPAADLDNDGRITVLDARKLALIRTRM
jgi:hypothetical protein